MATHSNSFAILASGEGQQQQTGGGSAGSQPVLEQLLASQQAILDRMDRESQLNSARFGAIEQQLGAGQLQVDSAAAAAAAQHVQQQPDDDDVVVVQQPPPWSLLAY